METTKQKNRKTLIHMHICKTGGTTLSHILNRNFPGDATYSMDPVKDPCCVDKFNALGLEEKEKIKHLSVHTIWGLHKYLHNPSLYITFLREPVDRVISEYYYIRSRLDHPLCSKLREDKITLKEYVEKGMHLSWNCQTRHIRGLKEGAAPPVGPLELTEKDLEIAKKNLHNYFLFGVLEKFDESLILLKRRLGWRMNNILYLKLNTHKNRPSRDKVSKEIRILIEKYNKLDIELYQFANSIVEERIYKNDISFKRELEIFRVHNKIYGILEGIRNSFIVRPIISIAKLVVDLIKGRMGFSCFYQRISNRLRLFCKNHIA